jgi:hypothetical protein
MKKAIFILALVSLLSIGLLGSGSYAATMGEDSAFSNSFDLIGGSVRDSHGEYLGVINQVLIDSGGHAFAVINHGDYDLYGESGVNTPVPFEALHISQGMSSPENIVFTMDTEHLDFAPYLDPTRPVDRQFEADVYRYYGIQPYWTENADCTR